MPTRKHNNTLQSQWDKAAKQGRLQFPHLYGWLENVDAFSELRIKARDDGTYLAIAKGYGTDGGPVVCFGVGYDYTLAILALDKTIQAGKWRYDKPWVDSTK